MESETALENPDPAQGAADQLKAVEDARALVYTRYPQLGRWYPPAFGAVVAIFVAAAAAPPLLTIAVWAAELVVFGIVARHYINKRGVVPSGRGAPPEVSREMSFFLAGYCLSIGAIAVCYFLVSWWSAALLAFPLFTTLIAVYEARYARAARQIELDRGLTDPVGRPA